MILSASAETHNLIHPLLALLFLPLYWIASPLLLKSVEPTATDVHGCMISGTLVFLTPLNTDVYGILGVPRIS